MKIFHIFEDLGYFHILASVLPWSEKISIYEEPIG